MKNRSILKQLYNIISSIKNININIFVEEIYESQIELHLKNKKIKKNNIDYGVRIIIDNKVVKKYKSISFLNYEDMFYQVVNYIKETLNIELNYKKDKVYFKKYKEKNIVLNNQQKYNIMSNIIKKLTGYDSLKVALYEKKENIFIIQSSTRYILNIKNFYTKMMLKGNIDNNEIYDFILSDHGYKNLTKSKTMDLIERFKKITSIKTSNVKIPDGDYDLILSNNCGTVFHEIFGHNLELDLINKSSKELFKKGNNIGNNLITFIDNTHYNNDLLDLQYDDYINNVKNKILIKNGKIIDYINTLRSENYKFYPTTRMTNSYLKPNNNSLPLNIYRIKKGIYIYKIGAGKLYLEKQKFEITIDAGYMIINGMKKGKISNITFQIDVDDFIKKIKYVGNDLNFIPTVCGSSSGNIFCYAGTPTVLVKNISIKQNVKYI